MSENQSTQYAQQAIKAAIAEDWAASFQNAKKAYNGGIRVPAITWILGYCYAEGLSVSQDTNMAHRYLSECADAEIDSHDMWVDKARGYLCINSIGNHPKFSNNEQEAIRYGELLYYDNESDFREEALSVLCVAYADVTSNVFDAQKGAIFLRQAIKSTNSNVRQVATPLYTGLRELIARDIANKYDGNGSYSPGIYTIRAREIWPMVKDASSSGSSGKGTSSGAKSGGCYIATCVYGSYDCPEVWTLRRYRDQVLLTTNAGKIFVKTYYAVSPIMVKCFGETKLFRLFWRRALDKWTQILTKNGFSSLPYEDK